VRASFAFEDFAGVLANALMILPETVLLTGLPGSAKLLIRSRSEACNLGFCTGASFSGGIDDFWGAGFAVAAAVLTGGATDFFNSRF
jgi:hypothetical protein